jgi:site-specific DNA-methyltransferase (adenine-specific)
MGRFSAQCEYVVWATAGPRDLNEEIGILPGIVRGYPKPSEKHHITGKPVEVLQELVRIAPVGGVIVDPFCGAASTGVAALLEGRRFLGCELVGDYVEVSRERLRATETNSTIQARAAGQGALFR